MPARIAKLASAPSLAALCRALDVPGLADTATQLAGQARGEHWSHEEFLAACLERELAARRSSENEGEQDDNPLAPQPVARRLRAEYDDNPLAPVNEVELPVPQRGNGQVPASVGAL